MSKRYFLCKAGSDEDPLLRVIWDYNEGYIVARGSGMIEASMQRLVDLANRGWEVGMPQTSVDTSTGES